MFRASGMTWATDFQKKHHADKTSMGEGHWKDFLKFLALDRPMKCVSCACLRDKVVKPTEAIQDAPPAAPYSGKGRPGSGQNAQLLVGWIAEQPQ